MTNTNLKAHTNTKANNKNNNKTPTKQNKIIKKKVKSNHPIINCAARTCNSGLQPYTCVTGA